MVVFNPFGVDKVVGFASVGFTYGYSRGGPLRGHNRLVFYTPNFCVPHPLPSAQYLGVSFFRAQRGRAAIQDSRFQIQEGITSLNPGTEIFARREEIRQ
jgi:hypothetical protein